MPQESPIRNITDDKGETLVDWILAMAKAHPKIGVEFEIGVEIFERGEPRPYDNFSGRLNKNKKLLQLGWDMARRYNILGFEGQKK